MNWTKTIDHQPEIGKDVLGYNSFTDSFEVTYFLGNRIDNPKTYLDYDLRCGNFYSHWMQLPEPPDEMD